MDENGYLPALRGERSEQKLMGYIPANFILTALPLKSTKKNTFKRSYNGQSISIITDEGQCVPYGVYGRNLLSIITTHAVYEGSKCDGPVEVYYESVTELCNEMQVPRTRGAVVTEQLESFSHASFHFRGTVETRIKANALQGMEDLVGDEIKKTTVKTGQIPFMKGMIYDEYEDNNGNKKNKAFRIFIHPDFVEFCKKHAVPIDYSVYAKINSPVTKDLYAWCCYRNNSIYGNEEIFIPRELLVEQFMPVNEGENSNQILINNFGKICEKLREIKQKYYPELNLTIDSQNLGIRLKKSQAVIQQNDMRYVLVTQV